MRRSKKKVGFVKRTWLKFSGMGVFGLFIALVIATTVVLAGMFAVRTLTVTITEPVTISEDAIAEIERGSAAIYTFVLTNHTDEDREVSITDNATPLNMELAYDTPVTVPANSTCDFPVTVTTNTDSIAGKIGFFFGD